jgi:hypothetical protein
MSDDNIKPVSVIATSFWSPPKTPRARRPSVWAAVGTSPPDWIWRAYGKAAKAFCTFDALSAR